MVSNVLFLSLDMSGNDVEYGLSKVNKELARIDHKLTHLQTDLAILLLEIEKELASLSLSEAI